jgi:hypothetical protein
MTRSWQRTQPPDRDGTCASLAESERARLESAPGGVDLVQFVPGSALEAREECRHCIVGRLIGAIANDRRVEHGQLVIGGDDLAKQPPSLRGQSLPELVHGCHGFAIIHTRTAITTANAMTITQESLIASTMAQSDGASAVPYHPP